MEKMICNECCNEFKFDWDYDVFRLRIEWDDLLDHKAGFYGFDLGYTGVICPYCGKEHVVSDKNDRESVFYGPYSSDKVFEEMGSDVTLLREYQELRYRFKNIKDENALNYIISLYIKL